MSEDTEKTKELLTRAFRAKQGINERLLCMRLIQATFATDIKSIIANTCMAASMVEEGYPDKLKDFDFKKFRIMKQIYSDINKTEFKGLPITVKKYYYNETQYARICPIPWSIDQSEEIFKNYIEPWMVTSLNYREEGIKKHKAWLTEIIHRQYSYGVGSGCKKRIDIVPSENAEAKMKEWIGKTCPECKKEIEKGIIDSEQELCVVPAPYWSYFFEASQYITHDGLKKLCSAFNEWSRDECGKAIMTMGSLVSQNVYDEVLKQIKAGPEETKKTIQYFSRKIMTFEAKYYTLKVIILKYENESDCLHKIRVSGCSSAQRGRKTYSQGQ